MFDTSLDLMYAAIAVSVIVFTGFLVWALYYFGQILKQGHEMVRDIRQKVAEFEEMLGNIKDKVMTSASSISFIASEIKTVVDLVNRKKSKSLRGKKKDEEEDDDEE